jgi:hypothetical protein
MESGARIQELTAAMDPALVYSLGACAISVALEAVFAGGGIKQHLEAQPAASPIAQS